MRMLRNGYFFEELEKDAIRKGFKDLYSITDRKKDMLHKIEEICDYLDKFGKLEHNNELCGTLTNLKLAKNGIGTTVWHTDYQRLVEKRRYPDLFNTRDLKSDGLKALKEIYEWVLINNRNPSKESDNPKEKRLGHKLSNLKSGKKKRKNKNGYLNNAWFQEWQDYADSIGHSEWFDIKSLPEKKEQKANEIFDWINKNGRLPSSLTTDRDEKRLWRRIQHIKERNDPTYIAIATNRGHPGFFNHADQIKEGLKFLEKLCSFGKENGFYPKATSKIPEIRHMAQKVTKLKLGKKIYMANLQGINLSGKGHIFYPEYQAYLDNQSCSDALDYNTKEDDLQNFDEICSWVLLKGKLPHVISESQKERTLGIRLSNLRRYVKNGGENTNDYLALAEKRKCSYLFNKSLLQFRIHGVPCER